MLAARKVRKTFPYNELANLHDRGTDRAGALLMQQYRNTFPTRLSAVTRWDRLTGPGSLSPMGWKPGSWRYKGLASCVPG